MDTQRHHDSTAAEVQERLHVWSDGYDAGFTRVSPHRAASHATSHPDFLDGFLRGQWDREEFEHRQSRDNPDE